MKIPIGNRQLAPVQDATREQLETFLAWYRQNIDTPSGDKFAEAALAAAERVEALRALPPDDPATSIVPAPAEAAALHRVSDVQKVTARLARIAEQCHLVSPATQVDAMPVGFGVSVSTVQVDPNPNRGDVYPVDNGKVALSGVKLHEIAAAAGVSWDASRGGRVDDGSDPRYVHYVAVGIVKNFDGTPRTISGQVQVDMRDGSDTITRGGKGGGPMSAARVQGIRAFILQHAESKARNRAVASGFGIRRAYDPRELRKPFAIARLIYTGVTDDPELTRQLAIMNAQAAMQATSALYGSPPPPLTARSERRVDDEILGTDDT